VWQRLEINRWECTRANEYDDDAIQASAELPFRLHVPPFLPLQVFSSISPVSDCFSATMLERVRCPRVSSGKAGQPGFSRRSLSVHYLDREFHSAECNAPSCARGWTTPVNSWTATWASRRAAGVGAVSGGCGQNIGGRIERQGPITAGDNVFESNTNAHPDRRIGFFVGNAATPHRGI
jgi:hypothetical protein